MTSQQWATWGISSAVRVGGAAINGAGFGGMVGGLSQNAAVSYGLQKGAEAFVTSGLTAAGNALANGVDWNSMTMDTKSWKMTNSFNMDWNSVGIQTAVAGANGFAAGSLASGLGGSYNSSSGSFGFKDTFTSTAMGKNVNMFYSGNIMQVADTFGSIVGEGVNYAYGNNFRLNLGQGIGLGINHDGKVVDDYTGGGIGLNDLVHSAMNMKYVGFQAGNMNTPAGRSTMSYVNLNNGVGNSGLADDIISGNKKVVYSDALKESDNNFGHAGNNTIELSTSAILDQKDSFLQQKLAFYTATMAHEGTHLDQDASMSGPDKERQAYSAGTLTMMNLEKKYGLSVAGNDQYAEMAGRGAYFAMTGDAAGSGLDMSGDAFKIKVKSGDTLGNIAQKNNLTLNQLLKMNKQITKPDSIEPGDQIEVGGGVDLGKAAGDFFGGIGKGISDYVSGVLTGKNEEKIYVKNSKGENELVGTDVYIAKNGIRAPYIKQGDSRWGSQMINNVDGRPMSDYGCFISSTSIFMAYMGYMHSPGDINSEGIKDNAFDGANFNRPLDVVNDIVGSKVEYGTEERKSKFTDTLETRLNQGLPTIMKYQDQDDPKKMHFIVASGYRTDASGKITGYLVSDPGNYNSDKNTYISKTDLMFKQLQNYNLKKLIWYKW